MIVAAVTTDFFGGMTGLLGGTGGGTPRAAAAADFLGVVGWAGLVVVVPVDVAEGNVALVVTWKVTLPSLLVVVNTLVPAEAETATRGDVACIVEVEVSRPAFINSFKTVRQFTN